MTATRRIVAWTNLTLDGYTSGPEGPAHDSWLYEHVGQPATAEYFEGIWRNAAGSRARIADALREVLHVGVGLVRSDRIDEHQVAVLGDGDARRCDGGYTGMV